MDIPNPDQLVHIATLKKPYGIKGWLWVFSHTENRADIFAMSPWYMKTAVGFKPLTVVDWRTQGSGLVAQFAQVADRNCAETMQGTTIWIAKEHFPALEEDEYYWSDLVGLTVRNEQNECLGVVHSLFETGANDVIVVRPSSDSIDNEERMIPWHASVVLYINVAEKTMTVAWEKDY